MENKETNINIDNDVLLQALDQLIAEWMEEARKNPKHSRVKGMKWGLRKSDDK